MKRISRKPICTMMIVLAGCTSHQKPPSIPPELLKGAVLSPAKMQAGCLLPEPSLLDAVRVPTTIEMNIKVGASGHPVDARILKSTGYAVLDDAFVSAAKNCSFSPATANGTPTDYWYKLPYTWAPKQNFAGPSRCFPLPYPRSALFSGETDTVKVEFRLHSNSPTIETRFTSAQKIPVLTQLSVSAVERCFDHSEVRQGLDVERWYSVSFDWRIRE